MPKKTQLSTEVVQAALEAVHNAKTSDDLRMAQTLVVPSLFDVSDHLIGQIIGRSRETVGRLRFPAEGLWK